MYRNNLLIAGLLVGLTTPGATSLSDAAELTVHAVERSDLKAVFGQVESRDVVPARARLGGTIVSLSVEEGSAVKSGDILAVVVDDKLALQLGAIDARLKALKAELENARTELERARKLFQGGVVPKSRLDQLQTQADVLTNQLAAAEADRAVLLQQQTCLLYTSPSPRD